MKARLFWHVFCAAHWFDICNEILQSLHHTQFPFPIETHIVGTERDRNDIAELAGTWGITPHVIRHDKNAYEYWSIAAVHEYACNNDGLVCYIHNKGTTNPSPTYSRWRWCMLQKIIVEWQERIEDFTAFDVDAVGCFHLPYWPCFAGNWWWAKTEFVKTRERPTVSANRFDYEKWLLTGATGHRLLSLVAEDMEPYVPQTHCRLGNPHRQYILWNRRNGACR